MVDNVLRHVAIVMDGNGRWARERGESRLMGHRAGLQRAREIVYACMEFKTEELTLFAFSLENRFRPEEEVEGLMGIFSEALQGEFGELTESGIRIRFVGDVDYFAPELKSLFQEIEKKTSHYDSMLLNVAMNYGGRWDIAQAAEKTLKNNNSHVDCSDLQKQIANFLSVGEVDLFIRTGGEQRLSNFLLWQCAYSELYFTPTLWPNFDKAALLEAFAWFAGRQRKFGLI